MTSGGRFLRLDFYCPNRVLVCIGLDFRMVYMYSFTSNHIFFLSYILLFSRAFSFFFRNFAKMVPIALDNSNSRHGVLWLRTFFTGVIDYYSETFIIRKKQKKWQNPISLTM